MNYIELKTNNKDIKLVKIIEIKEQDTYVRIEFLLSCKNYFIQCLTFPERKGKTQFIVEHINYFDKLGVRFYIPSYELMDLKASISEIELKTVDFQ